MTLEARKQAELGAKCDAFLVELQQWKTALKDLPQHTSQLTRLTQILEPLCEDLARQVGKLAGADVAAKSFALGANVLLLHRIWAHYRDKLAQRFVPWQRPCLEIADDLAYRFWRPALDTALAAAKLSAKRAAIAKEPPLVYLNGDISPLTMTRKIGFSPERAEGLDERRVEWAQKVVQRSPVPVIGMPYFASRHIPDLIVIAHEVGHNVEDDFGLTTELTNAVCTAVDGTGRAAAWSTWLGEVFADVWGVLSAGPAFVDALLDLVVAAPAFLQSEHQPDHSGWSLYPTTALRAALLFETLEKVGLKDAATSRRKSFCAMVPGHAMAEYDADVPRVIEAILGCRPVTFGESILATSGFKAERQEDVLEEAECLAAGYQAKTRDTALLAQAIVLAFGTRPDHVSEKERAAILWDSLRGTVVNGVRSSFLPTESAGVINKHDRALAAELINEWPS